MKPDPQRSFRAATVKEREFEDGRPRGADQSLATEPSEPSSSAPATLRGLCADCALAAECTFPRPEGGVWHCEEYR